MTQAELYREIAQATGESIRTVAEMGFVPLTRSPVELERDPLVVECEEETPSPVDSRHRRDAATLAGHLLHGPPAAGCPRLAQDRRQRDVPLILGIQNRPVLRH